MFNESNLNYIILVEPATPPSTFSNFLPFISNPVDVIFIISTLLFLNVILFPVVSKSITYVPFFNYNDVPSNVNNYVILLIKKYNYK